jgi:ribosome biogenesis protein SSF1/2
LLLVFPLRALFTQVEEGLCAGAVMYHAHVTKTKSETSAQQAAKDEVARLKAQRRRQQEENVRRKEVRADLTQHTVSS